MFPNYSTSSPKMLYQDTVDVLFIFLPKCDKELFQNHKVHVREDGAIDLCILLKSLKDLSLPIETNMISYYSYSNDMYINCGKDPICYGTFIPAREIAVSTDGRKQITIKVRKNLTGIPIESKLVAETPIAQEEASEQEEDRAKPKIKAKEKKIGEVVEKVLLWRKLFTGIVDPETGQKVKLSLEDAAKRVGVAKKSLDDYLLQVKMGKMYGFDFNSHYNDKIGLLRSFVKRMKNKRPENREMDEE